MKHSSKKPRSSNQSPQIAFRLEEPKHARFTRVVKASKRTQTSIIEEALDAMLPALEQRYKEDLAKAA